MSPDPEEPAAPPVPPPSFGFHGFAIQRIRFEHLAPEPREEGLKRPINVGNQMKVNLAARIDVEKTAADVTLGIEVRPDPKWQAYLIEVEVTGRFSGTNAPAELFDQFCKTAAPTILFPYLREAVHRVTQDGKHGPCRIQPVNIAALIQNETWKTATVEETKTLD